MGLPSIKPPIRILIRTRPDQLTTIHPILDRADTSLIERLCVELCIADTTEIQRLITKTWRGPNDEDEDGMRAELEYRLLNLFLAKASSMTTFWFQFSVLRLDAYIFLQMTRRFHPAEVAAVNDQPFPSQAHMGDGRFVMPTSHANKSCQQDSITNQKLETGNGTAASRSSAPGVKKNVEIGYAIRCSGKILRGFQSERWDVSTTSSRKMKCTQSQKGAISKDQGDGSKSNAITRNPTSFIRISNHLPLPLQHKPNIPPPLALFPRLPAQASIPDQAFRGHVLLEALNAGLEDYTEEQMKATVARLLQTYDEWKRTRKGKESVQETRKEPRGNKARPLRDQRGSSPSYTDSSTSSEHLPTQTTSSPPLPVRVPDRPSPPLVDPAASQPVAKKRKHGAALDQLEQVGQGIKRFARKMISTSWVNVTMPPKEGSHHRKLASSISIIIA
ncbi:uncharacterized protein PAC_15139 [Phialocephala subalpina]|uniref:Uncharacterized protein n=1 Tax=Phialocephala subalpina TaxID=576137 RepID=A0A1L7XJM0_9HELO|nr:uncharacterized protein PAC_15139 [Phialocephala subalpina]